MRIFLELVGFIFLFITIGVSILYVVDKYLFKDNTEELEEINSDDIYYFDNDGE